MTTKIKKWGNSQGLRLPKAILAETAMSVGDEVMISTQEGAIVVTPVRPVRRKYRLEDLVRAIPDDYEAQEVYWGPAVGNEVW